MARKKKRSAKQLANDRRLGRMAKARAKKKRGGRRKKVARKNPCGTNPHRRAASKQKIAAVIKKAKRKVSAKSHLWLVFLCRRKTVHFMIMKSDGKYGWSGDKGKAIRMKSKSGAASIAKGISKKRGYATYQLGVVNAETTTTQIRAYCEGKT